MIWRRKHKGFCQKCGSELQWYKGEHMYYHPRIGEPVHAAAFRCPKQNHDSWSGIWRRSKGFVLEEDREHWSV